MWRQWDAATTAPPPQAIAAIERLAEFPRALQEKLANPCFVELIWSYWQEEAGLVQTMNAITWRFQNRRGAIVLPRRSRAPAGASQRRPPRLPAAPRRRSARRPAPRP